MKKIFLLLFILFPFNALAAQWIPDFDQSHIAFSGSHAGTAFTGNFTSWKAHIDFDPTAPDKGSARITVFLSSAHTGDATYDATLPQSEWLNSKKETTAIWKSTAFRLLADGRYEANGTLSLRGHTQPVTIQFTLTPANDALGTTTMHGTTTLNRLDFGIGASADATGEWVSLEIPLDIVVVAKPSP